MRRWIILSLCGAGALSCGLHDLSGDGQTAVGGNVWEGLVGGQGSAGEPHDVCYMTVVDYKKGYDWHSDEASESVKCSLVVYADGVPVMKVPVGPEYETSADPDMHRLIDGSLYTDYSTETETVIKKNGALLFRYTGRESVCGMEVIDDDVYTLGQNRDGDGFAFRKNGEPIISRNSGYVIGRMQNDSDTLSFSFCEQIIAAEGEMERYYNVINGRVTRVEVSEDIGMVWDIISHKGRVMCLASLIGNMSPVIVDGEKTYHLAMPRPGSRIISGRLFTAGDTVVIDLLYMTSDKLRLNTVWLGKMILNTFAVGSSVSALSTTDDGGVYCAVNPAGGSSHGVIYSCGEPYDMPPGYKVMGDRSISMVNGILHVGLSSTENGGPIVWKDQVLDTLEINGYISGIIPM